VIEKPSSTVQFGMITADHAFFFQRTDTAQTWGSRQTDALGQFNIGNAALVLQFGQQAPVDLIKVGHKPEISPFAARVVRRNDPSD
jgi:hypothetical protein